MDLTNEDVADILALLDSLPYDSLDLETTRFRLTLRRAPGGGWTEESQVLTEPAILAPATDATTALAASTPAGSGQPGRAPGTTPGPGPGQAGVAAQGGAVAQGGIGQAGAAAQGDSAADGDDGLVTVPAPLPGTFYRAPRPGAEPFVQVGDVVTPDTVVAIVETMKLMNSVHAGTTGRVARISLENGDFAPLGATLMLIEPDQ